MLSPVCIPLLLPWGLPKKVGSVVDGLVLNAQKASVKPFGQSSDLHAV